MHTKEVFSFRYFDRTRGKWLTSTHKLTVEEIRVQYVDAIPLAGSREVWTVYDNPAEALATASTSYYPPNQN
ncbi:hypothetical protein [Chitinolyticbacter albus]|uniref:hypothetical protein n=1 Tax=Chitinolyticbacter albus TaxID=2961951 RepID=UPI00210B7951|nr:hypothetical protein [Chitinolyticbacter albus]